MRIRTQNLIAIVPLFLGMALATGAMTYSAARQEMRWGLEEEATSLSVAMAEFSGGMGPLPARLEGLRGSFERVLAHGQARYVFVLDEAGERVWSIGGRREANAPYLPEEAELRPSPEQSGALAAGAPAVLGPITELSSGESVLVSLSPIPGAGGGTDGLLGVVIDASRLDVLSAELRGRLAWLTLLALGIGALAALFISSLLTRNVRALSKAALEVAGGEYDRQIEIGTIQEISDLSNTFNTMSSVLKDMIERTRRTLLEGEQFRTPLDLAATYRQDQWPDLDRAYEEVRVATHTIGGGHPGDLFGVVEEEGTVIVFVGRVTERHELDSAVSAAAARRALEAGTERWPFGQVADEVCRLLRLRLEAVRWRPGAESEAVLTSYGAGSSPSLGLPLDGEGTVLLHTFPGAGEALQRWKRVFRHMPPRRLVETLGRILEGENGTLVAIGREPALAAATAAAPDAADDFPSLRERDS